MGKISDEDLKGLKLIIDDTANRHGEIITVCLDMKLPVAPSIAYSVLDKLTERFKGMGFVDTYCCSVSTSDTLTVVLPVYIIPKIRYIKDYTDEADLLKRVTEAIGSSLTEMNLDYQKWKGHIPILVSRENSSDSIIRELVSLNTGGFPDPINLLDTALDEFPVPYNNCRIIGIKSSFSLNPFYTNGFQNAIRRATMAKGSFVITETVEKGFTVVVLSDDENIQRCIEFVIWAWQSFVKHTNIGANNYPVDDEDGYLESDVFNLIPRDELVNSCKNHQKMFILYICKRISMSM